MTSRGWPRFGLPQLTAYRHLDEMITVLAARAPGLQEALERAVARGTAYSSACCARS
ncbi:MAG: hypothetical protein JO132_08820 [Streptosporangiaceae bacterium]|nr:hypothetical protein [Streptosporangiaceae bacterium]